VARNKLLDNLNTNSSAPLNLLLALKKSASPVAWALLHAVSLEAEKQNAPIYVVGGFVRDLLLGSPNLDLDLVVEGDAIRLGRVLVKRVGGRLLPHQAFGTAVWSLVGDQAAILRRLHVPRKKTIAAQVPEFIDLISARRESYTHSGALPDVVFSDIHEDQYRRDFTINTLALRLDGPAAGQLLDPWRGLSDVHRGLLRTLHAQSFSDDPTRMLRMLRLAGRLGFKIEASTLKQLKSYLHRLEAISGERIYKELMLVLLEENRVAILKEMQRLGVLSAINPNLEFSSSAAQSLKRAAMPTKNWEIEDFEISDLRFVLWFMCLPPQIANAVSDRLRLPLPLRRAALGAAKLQPELRVIAKLAPSAVVAQLEKELPLALYALFLNVSNGTAAKTLERYVTKWRHVRSRSDGNTLRKKGLKPGPAYSKILTRLRAAWLDGEIKNAKQERALLEKLVDEHR
jgi:tRNA nucleotidyltransferase (CCA-adding enzyme)